MIFNFTFKKSQNLILIFSLAILSACAQGVNLQSTPEAIGILPDGKARVFFYRKGEFVGSGIQPVVKIDGVKTQDCRPNGVFIAELNAGKRSFTVSTEVDSNLVLDIKAGETKYIECKVGLGIIVWRVHLESVDSAEGEKAVGRFVYLGTYRE